MSKIAFFNTTAYGHINPTLPVVKELARRGEEIIYYNDLEFHRQIEATGAQFRPYRNTQLTPKAIADSLKDGIIANTTALHLTATEELLPFVLDELASEQPDLVIFDSLAIWGKMATTIMELRGAASITHFILDIKSSRMSMREIFSMTRAYLPALPAIVAARRRLIKGYGKAAFPPTDPLLPMRDKLNIVYTTRDLQPDTTIIDNTFCFVGPSIAFVEGDDFAEDEISQELLIYISLGTIHSGNVEFFQLCFEAFSSYAANFLLSAGRDTDIATLGKIPSNFTVKPFVPQLEVLRQAKAFVTHGGMNSIHESLYFGVPMLVVPHQLEQLLNGRCVEVRGAARVLEHLVRGTSLDPSTLRDALDSILRVPTYADSAHLLQQGLHSSGGFRLAADNIQSYLQANQCL